MNSPAKDPRLSSVSKCGIPLRLEPQFVERVWGAPRDAAELSLLYPISHPSIAQGLAQRIGEVWLTGNENRIANGPWAGKTLQELTNACGRSLVGDGHLLSHPSGQPVFPFLVKFLFTTDKLSVQMHPSDASARPQRSWGKTEIWHILRAAPGASLAVGFRKDVRAEFLTDAAQLREAATTGAIERMLNWRAVEAGDTYFVPAGTVHAIGAGIVLCEIQQNSDITYRLYDYNRPGTDGKPRALHINEAIEVINPRSDGGRTDPYDWPGASGARQLLAACPYFATERWELRESVKRPTSHHLEIWVALQGSAAFEVGGCSETIHAGEVVIIPADAGTFSVRPRAMSVFLRTYPPDWEREIVEPLRAMGQSPEQLPRTCFPMFAPQERAS